MWAVPYIASHIEFSRIFSTKLPSDSSPYTKTWEIITAMQRYSQASSQMLLQSRRTGTVTISHMWPDPILSQSGYRLESYNL